MANGYFLQEWWEEFKMVQNSMKAQFTVYHHNENDYR